MKKTKLITAFVILTLLLTACASAFTASTPAKTNSAVTKISMENQLAAGTLKLDETEKAVDSKLANELLPLWQLLLQLKTSDSTATEEVAAVIQKIQQTMTVEQIQAIDEMQLTQQDVLNLVEGKSLTGSTSKSTTASNINNGGPGGPGGPPPDGGIPLGGGFAPQQNSTSQSQTSQSSAGSNSTLLIKEVIKVLQAKIQG